MIRKRRWQWCERCQMHVDDLAQHNHEGEHMQQQSIPGTEPPRNQELDKAIERWESAKADQKRAAEVTGVVRDVMIAAAVEAGVEKYPYTDSEGKRRILDVTVVRRARTKKAPSAKKERQDAEFERGRAEAEAEVEDPAAQAWTAEVARRRGEPRAEGARRGGRRGGNGGAK